MDSLAHLPGLRLYLANLEYLVLGSSIGLDLFTSILGSSIGLFFFFTSILGSSIDLNFYYCNPKKA